MKENTKSVSTSTKLRSAPVRLHASTKEKIDSLLDRANNKSFGRKVKVNDIIDMSIDLISDRHLKSLQENSLSNGDRLEMLLKSVSDANPSMSKDELIGLLLQGELKPTNSKRKSRKPDIAASMPILPQKQN
jgi:hypothetical protein